MAVKNGQSTGSKDTANSLDFSLEDGLSKALLGQQQRSGSAVQDLLSRASAASSPSRISFESMALTRQPVTSATAQDQARGSPEAQSAARVASAAIEKSEQAQPGSFLPAEENLTGDGGPDSSIGRPVSHSSFHCGRMWALFLSQDRRSMCA